MASLYCHIPFCEHKCLYCDFYSLETRTSMQEFVGALLQEIDGYREYGVQSTVDTLFFGGGTPSLLDPGDLRAILERLKRHFHVSDTCEITLEVNPGTVGAEKLQAYRALGVNRLSIGIQSFNDEELRFLTRIHSSSEAERAVRDAREAGFMNLSLDLIYSLPGQTLSAWAETLRRAVGLRPDHISAYSLIVEAQTPLFRMVEEGRVIPGSPEDEASFYEFTMEYLAGEGYEHYEVSSYARPGFRCRHNSAYWSHENYLGFGPSAHSFWRDAGRPAGRRWWNIASLSAYLERIAAGRMPVAAQEELGIMSLANERIFLGLRSDGLDLHRFEQDFRFRLQERQPDFILRLLEGGLATMNGDILRLTAKGYLLCDEIARRLLS